MRFETEWVAWTINPDATVDVTDRSGNRLNVMRRAMASIVLKGERHEASKALLTEPGTIQLTFGPSGMTVTLRCVPRRECLSITVIDAPVNTLDSLCFCDVRLTARAASRKALAFCALAANLQTRVERLPGSTDHLEARCYPRFGLEGARVLLLACPPDRMRLAMQRVVSDAPDVPHSPVGGPWAMDGEHNRGSYLFNFSDLTEQTVDDWISLARSLGIRQIDFHGGHSHRFGDCRPNPELYPQGRRSLKAVIDRLHAAGFLAGLHTYAFFIDKACPWVTPKPHPGLAKDVTMTLATSVGPDDPVIPLSDIPDWLSAITGFFVRNSVTVQIGDELVTYAGISADRRALTGCTRGALGTRAAAHPAGAPVGHLKECFGLFAPDGDSPLLDEVAQAAADTYNECGFDMMYLDALDGEDVLGGWDAGWHYGSKFVFTLFRKLRKPPIMEMSTFHHHLWYVRSRMGAWDHPVRSHRRFIDLHVEANKACANMYLPAHLGWWTFIADDDPRKEPTFTEDIEYLCAKAAGHDCGISPMGVTPDTLKQSANLQRLSAIMRRWEELRLAHRFSESARRRLRQPRQDFTLTDVRGRPGLRPASHQKRRLEWTGGAATRVTLHNPYGKQPFAFRLQVLWSADRSPEAPRKTLIDHTTPLALITNTEGVTLRCQQTAALTPDRQQAIRLTVATTHMPNKEKPAQYSPIEHGQRVLVPGRYAALQRAFDPPIDLSTSRGLGVWVRPDNSGAILNLQLRSPEHLSSGLADHYIDLIGTEWRYLTLIEPEGDRIDDCRWPYGDNVYALYRELVDPAQVSALLLWLTALPNGGVSRCLLGPVEALPLVRRSLERPVLQIGDRSVALPFRIATGEYVECDADGQCTLYSAAGDLLERTQLPHSLFAPAGTYDLQLHSGAPADGVRALLTAHFIGPASAI